MTLFNPLKKISCPFCNQKFHPSECAIKSRTNPGKTLYDPNDPTQRTTFQRLLSRIWIEPLDGPVYTPEWASRECPHCKGLWPYRLELTNNRTIAIIGNLYSGKSHYITAFLDQLKNGGMVQQGTGYVRSTAQTSDTKELFYESRKILFVDQTELAATLRLEEPGPGDPMVFKPLIFLLTLRDDTDRRLAKNVNLMIYDIAGEDIADPMVLARLGWPILQAHAIIYLADPLSMPSVKGQLKPHMLPPPEILAKLRGVRSHDLLLQIMDVFERYRGLEPGQRIDIPVAIMLSKSDLLEHTVQGKQQKYTFMQNVIYDGRLNLGDVETVNKEVVELLTNLGEDGLLRERRRFSNSNVCFFATSATGYPPDAQGKFQNVQPRRCLDPLLWILWRLGAVIAYDGQ